MKQPPQMKSKVLQLCIAIVLLCTTVFLPNSAKAVAPVRLSDFGERGLAIYESYAVDQTMMRALIATDLAEGRSIANPDEQAISRVAQSMSSSPLATVEGYVAYYTASASLKQKIMAASNRLVNIDNLFSGKVFPIPFGYEAWYGDSFGAPRGDQGERSHKGIDMAVAYGVPIVSMGDGVIEAIGWNTLGGWRIGVRDVDGLYYYYGHMSSFAENMKVGTKVKSGQTIGYIGDSGYGPLGTTGIMTPHLHICIYEGAPKTACNTFALLNATKVSLDNR